MVRAEWFGLLTDFGPFFKLVARIGDVNLCIEEKDVVTQRMTMPDLPTLQHLVDITSFPKTSPTMFEGGPMDSLGWHAI